MRLDFELIDRGASNLGATTEGARARLFGVSRSSLSRFRRGLMTPGLGAALRIASVLNLSVEDITVSGMPSMSARVPPTRSEAP